MKQLRAGLIWAVGGLVCIAAPAAAKAPTGDQDLVSYRLKSGESLYSIGVRYFIDKTAYDAVRRFNRITDARKLSPGALVSIPSRYLKGKPLDAQIAAFRGALSVENEGVALVPSVGSKIMMGTVLQTGDNGFVTLSLSNGSRVTIPSRSRVRVIQMRQLLLTGSTDFDFALDKGRAEAAVTPAKNANDRFRLRTPIAVSAVRGTRFRIGYDDVASASLTEVVEGGVAVGGPALGADPTPVDAGFGAAAMADGQVKTEALLAAPALLNPGRLQKDPSVNLSLSPVGAAQGYHVQLAKDAGFVDMVTEGRSKGPEIAFPSVEDGNYFVRAMAIAASGLEGLSESYTMRRRLTVVGGTAAALEPGTFAFKWLGQGAGKQSFRFQLLRHPKDTVAIVDEVGLETNMVVLTGMVPDTYYWRVGVRQFGTDDVSESWTPAEKFVVSEPES
jgi:hypothetical protein